MGLKAKILFFIFLATIGFASPQPEGKSHADTFFRHEVGVRSPVQWISIKGVNLAYSDPDFSSGLPVLIALHAIGHGGRDFDLFRRHFAGRYRIVTLDWPGQGNSGSDQEPASVDRYAKLFTNFVEQRNLDRFVILGNSIGGGVAIQYASENPDKVRALILSDPAGLDEGGLIANILI